MIRERYIKEWAARHPWRRAEQVEQDLGITGQVAMQAVINA